MDRTDLTKFADLGIDFPLFEAPVRSCAAHVEPAICCSCNTEQRYFDASRVVFWVGACPECGAFNKGTAGDCHFEYPFRYWNCHNCTRKLTDRMLTQTEEKSLYCFRCIKEQGGYCWKETGFGNVNEDSLLSGITDGIPGLTEADVSELVVVNENWNDTDILEDRVVSRGVRIAPEYLRQLLMTPQFHSWQGEIWLFCCKRPMIFIGYWFDAVRVLNPIDKGELFREIYQTADPTYATLYEDWSAASRLFEGSDPEMYVFRCPKCERLRCYIDCS